MPGTTAQPKMEPPVGIRWAVLVFASLAMFGNYYVYDSIAPLASVFTEQLGFTDTQIGALNAIYSLPNIITVLISGLIVDRFGARGSTLAFTALCLVGTAVTAASPSFPMMALGRLIFGLGAEAMIVAVTAALGQWFKGRQLGFAFGLNLSLARAGSYAADLSPSWAERVYASGWQAPLLLSVVFALVSLVAACVYWVLDRGAERRHAQVRTKPPEKFAWSDLWKFDRSYWYIVGLCVTFYSVILPFRSTFSIKYFQDAHGLSLQKAGEMNGYVFLAAIFVTPLFGLLVDRLGRRSLLMAIGSLCLMPVFLILGYTRWDLWISTVMIGLAYSLVPAVLWPAVPYLVSEHRLGTAYGLMTMLQNIGLTVCNLLAGWLNDRAGASADHPSGYLPMLWMFALLSLAGIVFSVLLRRHEMGPRGHGLETLRARGL